MWQPSLFSTGPDLWVDPEFKQMRRLALDEHSWLDFQPNWVVGADDLFLELVEGKEWAQRKRQMYDKVVQEPRLTWGWKADSGEPLQPPILDNMRQLLGKRYGLVFDSCGLNYYRDGNDSVAWHRDRIRKEVPDPVVVLVSVGSPRRFMYRPHGGGSSNFLMLGNGDLLVTGGRFQREWEHSVPKVGQAGPRISIAFRHGMYSARYLSE